MKIDCKIPNGLTDRHSVLNKSKIPNIVCVDAITMVYPKFVFANMKIAQNALHVQNETRQRKYRDLGSYEPLHI